MFTDPLYEGGKGMCNCEPKTSRSFKISGNLFTRYHKRSRDCATAGNTLVSITGNQNGPRGESRDG